MVAQSILACWKTTETEQKEQHRLYKEVKINVQRNRNAKQTAIHLTDLESALSESNFTLRRNAQRECTRILIKANARDTSIWIHFKKFSDNRYFEIT